MVRNTSLYVCQQCGNEESKWHGKCPTCGEWGSLVEAPHTSKAQKSKSKRTASKSIPLSDIKSQKKGRVKTNIGELDRVLGGGLVSGQVVLLAGEPGIGKSTILLQIADKLGKFLYVSGEESLEQIKVRADRLGIKRKTIEILNETDVDQIIATIVEKSSVKLGGVVVDSIQTTSTDDLSGMAGSVGQVKESTFRLVRTAKELNVPIFIVGQVTKEGSVAGPATLMHLVDTVLWFEGDKSLTVRLLRARKNRFGATDEVGIFEMKDKGLISVSKPEKLFVTSGVKNTPGSVISMIMQGTRPMLVEVQSLVNPTRLAFPKRIAQGIDSKRLELLIAVLIKRAGIPLYERDVFINIAGGINVKDPSIDLAICMSIASSFFDKPTINKMIAIGEVGLLGDIREAASEDRRVKEAKRLGFTTIINSKSHKHLRSAVGQVSKKK